MPHANLPGSDCCLGIIFALPIEAHSFERSVSETVTYRGPSLSISAGLLAERPVVWAVGGVGEAAAARAAQLIIDGHRPRRLVSAGFAGGLDASLPRGQLVLPDRLIDGSAAQRPPLAVDRELLETHGADQPTAGRTLVTVSDVVIDVAAKQLLRATTGASLVDMESYAVAAVAATAGIGFFACRVISDTADETLPQEVIRLTKPQSAMHRLGAALGAIGRRPRAAVDLWKLWEQSLGHSQGLARGLGDLARAMEKPADRG